MDKPTIMSEESHAPADLKKLRASVRIDRESDIYTDQLKELFEITHASLAGTPEFAAQMERFVADRTAGQDAAIRGSWIYFPWSRMLVHMLAEDDYRMVRTNRNRNLITEAEQKELGDACVALIGLSVGSNVATALAYGGIADTIKLAEFDTLETTNLNRIRARVDQIGMKKIDITMQQVYEINPFATLIASDERMTRDTIVGFMTQEPRPKVVFEIIDSFELKIHLRALAREQRIPVIMVTNLGDRVILDVERYDLDPTIEYFNGRAGKVPHDILEHPDITDADKHRYAVDLAGVQHIPQRALDSVDQIGKTLVGRPQLASTVTMAAAMSSYLVRRIVLGPELKSGSWLINLDTIFVPDNKLLS